MGKELFDYERAEIGTYEYYGFHRKKGQYHIDTKRLKKLEVDYAFPDELFKTSRNTHYFIPRHKRKIDYAINELNGVLQRLKSEWFFEFLPIIDQIKTPTQEAENVRFNEMMLTADSEDYDDCALNGFLAGVQRIKTYEAVVKSIYLQYLLKIQIEYMRVLLSTLRKKGYIRDDFGISLFLNFSKQLLKEKQSSAKVKNLDSWGDFDAFNKVVNFLKHNTKEAYNALTKPHFKNDRKNIDIYEKWVVFPKKGMTFVFQSGMYAGNWVKLNAETISATLDMLQRFSDELCVLLFDEDSVEAEWNSDEYLFNILKTQIIYPE